MDPRLAAAVCRWGVKALTAQEAFQDHNAKDTPKGKRRMVAYWKKHRELRREMERTGGRHIVVVWKYRDALSKED